MVLQDNVFTFSQWRTFNFWESFFHLDVKGSICEVTLNSCMKCRNRPLRTDHVQSNQGLHHLVVMCTHKRGQSRTKVYWHNLHFLEFLHHVMLGKEATNLADPLDQAILSHWPPEKHVMICALVQIYSKVSNRNMTN
jgi:hypothetical protein